MQNICFVVSFLSNASTCSNSIIVPNFCLAVHPILDLKIQSFCKQSKQLSSRFVVSRDAPQTREKQEWFFFSKKEREIVASATSGSRDSERFVGRTNRPRNFLPRKQRRRQTWNSTELNRRVKEMAIQKITRLNFYLATESTNRPSTRFEARSEFETSSTAGGSRRRSSFREKRKKIVRCDFLLLRLPSVNEERTTLGAVYGGSKLLLRFAFVRRCFSTTQGGNILWRNVTSCHAPF